MNTASIKFCMLKNALKKETKVSKGYNYLQLRGNPCITYFHRQLVTEFTKINEKTSAYTNTQSLKNNEKSKLTVNSPVTASNPT